MNSGPMALAPRVPTIVVLDRGGAVLERAAEIDAAIEAAVTRALSVP